MNSKVTVLMPVFNAEKYIGEAVQSVLKQTFRDFELLIINDGCTDRSMEIVRHFNDPRIVIVNQAKSGIAVALNRGLHLARGEFIARFDADDICYPQRLQKQYAFMQANPEYILIGSEADYMDSKGVKIYYYNSPGHTHEEIRQTIYKQCPFIHSTVFYKTAIAKELGGYDTKAHSFEDHLLWTKFIKKGKVLNFNEPLISVRNNPESFTVDEKRLGKKFLSLKKKILKSYDPITEKQEQLFLKVLNRISLMKFKHYSYHLMLAKKYLWNNFQPSLARKNIRIALSYKPVSVPAFGLFILSFMPRSFIHKLYRWVKSGVQ